MKKRILMTQRKKCHRCLTRQLRSAKKGDSLEGFMKCIHEQVPKAWVAGDIVDTYRSLILYAVVHLEEHPYRQST